MFRIGIIIGLKVVAIKGGRKKRSKQEQQRIEPEYVLFNDGKSYLILTEQDYYSYHDCSSSARYIEIYSDKISWEIFMNDYPDANCDI